MDPFNNPYSPGAGAPPFEIVGRDLVLRDADILLGRIQARRPEKSILLSGLRGVGKTVLLNEIERRAKKLGYHTISAEVHSEKSLGHLLAPYFCKLLYALDRAGLGHRTKRALGVLRGFIGVHKITFEDISFGIDIDPERGSADSGDIESDLTQLFVAIGEEAQDTGCAVAIFIDELQYLTKIELGALIMAMHKLQQKQLPMLLLGAGLPNLLELAGNSKAYAERLFNFSDVGPLSELEAIKLLQEPAKKENVNFDQEALDEIVRLTQGYPYFLQEWGYSLWNSIKSSPVTIKDVRECTTKVMERLDRNFFRLRFDRITPSEKTFLHVMAQLRSGPYKFSDIAKELNVSLSTLSPTRAHLIKKGMIYSPAYGYIAFTAPFFEQFLMREMRGFP